MAVSRRTADVAELVERACASDARAVARLISLVENDSPVLREVAAALAPYGGHAQVVGLTGSPGVGKSTSTNALVASLRAAGKRVGVLAVDPSSPFTGGALLGDRVRMQDHATDADVLIRSMASRGHLGGLSWSTPQALRVLDPAGFALVLVETLDVGQRAAARRRPWPSPPGGNGWPTGAGPRRWRSSLPPSSPANWIPTPPPAVSSKVWSIRSTGRWTPPTVSGAEIARPRAAASLTLLTV